MAEEAVPTFNAQLVGNAFVDQYYNVLYKNPEMVHRFYIDSSEVSRPDSDGSMSSASTMTVSLLGHAYQANSTAFSCSCELQLVDVCFSFQNPPVFSVE